MASYPGGNHDGKVHTHVLYHETTGKKVGEVHGGEEGLADKHESNAHERAEPNEQPSHYSDAQKHPGFKAVQAKIASKEGISKDRAGAILAAASRGASAKAKKANPHLKRVKG